MSKSDIFCGGDTIDILNTLIVLSSFIQGDSFPNFKLMGQERIIGERDNSLFVCLVHCEVQGVQVTTHSCLASKMRSYLV